MRMMPTCSSARQRVDRVLDRLSVVHKLALYTRKAHSDKRIGIVALQIKTAGFCSFQRSVKLRALH